MNYNFDSNTYWETRYKNNSNSGHGSYGEFQKFKTEYINNVIKTYNIKTINELGTGDGNMLSTYTGFDLYTGFDVSDTILNKLKNKFKDNNSIKFVSNPNIMEPADLTMSIDVSYHIINNNLFYEHLDLLYNKSLKYILIYSSNSNEKYGNYHILHRKVFDIFIDKYNVKSLDLTSNPIYEPGAVCFNLFEK